MTTTRTYEPTCGTTIDYAARKMVELANQNGTTYTAKFNDIEISAAPGADPEAIVTSYHAECDRRYEAYVNSPEYKEEQRQAAEAERARNEKLALALATAPEKMTIRDQPAWDDFVAKNTDGYGGGILRYAETWARLMESRMAGGDTLEACAEELSFLADNEGITGFMYGAAVATLAKVWIHGDELRRWHNLKTQIGHEGEKANAEGTTLNPAILNIG